MVLCPVGFIIGTTVPRLLIVDKSAVDDLEYVRI